MAFDRRDIEICVNPGVNLVEGGGAAVVPPIVQTSLFAFASFDGLLKGLEEEHRHNVYTRGRNPTVEALERQLAALERAEACQCFASGMAAVSAVFLGLLEAGDHLVLVNRIYGPTLQLAAELERFGIHHTVVLDPDPSVIEAVLRPETRLIWFENPGTMLFETLDIEALVALAESRGILTAIDNSWATPLLQKPLTLGVDLVIHSLSKYLSGHSDVVAGAVAGSEALLEKIFYRSFMLLGGILPPFDAWLVIRGLRTLPVRLQQHQENALEVARFLDGHAAVRRVFHPGLGGSQERGSLGGSTGLFSFELINDDFAEVQRVIDSLQLFAIGVSWGGVESLVISPNRGNPEALREQGIPPSLIRLSIGLEDVDLLIRDLDRALASPTRDA